MSTLGLSTTRQEAHPVVLSRWYGIILVTCIVFGIIAIEVSTPLIDTYRSRSDDIFRSPGL